MLFFVAVVALATQQARVLVISGSVAEANATCLALLWGAGLGAYESCGWSQLIRAYFSIEASF